MVKVDIDTPVPLPSLSLLPLPLLSLVLLQPGWGVINGVNNITKSELILDNVRRIVYNVNDR